SAQVVRNIANLHTLTDISSTADNRIETASLVAAHGHDLLDPDGMLDQRCCAGQHLEVAHDAQAAIDERAYVISFSRPGVSGFNRNRRLAAHGGRVFKIARRLGIPRPVVRDDDVIEAECEHHLARYLVLLLIPGLRPVTVRPQALVEVAAV